LTFDDGPDPQYTPQVLAILKKYNVKATFFVVGEECQAHPELVRREIDEGHEVENHTFTHPDLVRDNGISTEEEILRTGKAIEQITGRKPVYFRPPKRLFTHETVDIADADGYQIVLWTIGVEHKESKTIKDMADRVIKADKPGMIILAHDGRLNRTKTVKALPLVIKGYQSMGYRFVTVHELLTYKPKSGAVKLNPSRIHLCTAI
ncbi:MAG TPA: polysaccharide deacetylase family protein, partial [Syntrophomonadaceae bacterium]|nr:polysaccharide deacetylase family protein [Syntrophomonadaceae bacterium]